jgi:hypothetical protein
VHGAPIHRPAHKPSPIVPQLPASGGGRYERCGAVRAEPPKRIARRRCAVWPSGVGRGGAQPSRGAELDCGAYPAAGQVGLIPAVMKFARTEYDRPVRFQAAMIIKEARTSACTSSCARTPTHPRTRTRAPAHRTRTPTPHTHVCCECRFAAVRPCGSEIRRAFLRFRPHPPTPLARRCAAPGAVRRTRAVDAAHTSAPMNKGLPRVGLDASNVRRVPRPADAGRADRRSRLHGESRAHSHGDPVHRRGAHPCVCCVPFAVACKRLLYPWAPRQARPTDTRLGLTAEA